MNDNRLKRIAKRCLEILATLLLVFLFFGIFTSLLFSIFPSGISLTQIIDQRDKGKGDQGQFEKAAATLSKTENVVKSKNTRSIAWESARSGMSLYDRDAVQTFTDSSAQINFDSQNYLTMGSNSLVIIKRIEKDQGSSRKRSLMVIVEGEMRGRFASTGSTPFSLEIATPTAVAKIMTDPSSNQKTDFRITINPDKSSTIVVYKGIAEVTSFGKTVQIKENSAVNVKEGEAPMAAEMPLPSAPSLVSPADKAVFSYRELSPRVRLIWSRPKAGVLFHLQLAKDHAFKDIVLDRKLSDPEFTHGNLKIGDYYWRVSGIEEGREGRFSETKQLEVVQDKSPPLLKVNFPPGQVLEEKCVITGLTNPGCKIYVKGKQVKTDNQGGFSCEVTIKPGMNLVTVEAVDAVGNVTYRSHYVFGRFGQK